MDLQQLQNQHDALGVLATRFRAMVPDGAAPQPVAALRWEFARLLMEHLALEDRIFYPDMQKQSHGPLRETASRLQCEMAPIAQAFASYMTRWSDARIQQEWPLFCRETREMLTLVTNRIDKEEHLLFPLFMDAGLSHPYTHRQAS